MARSRLYPYRWDAWSAGERIASGTAWSMPLAQKAADAFYAQNHSPLLVLQITTPSGVVYFLTHPGRKWLPQSKARQYAHTRHKRP